MAPQFFGSHVPHYMDEILKSKFCLATAGYGHGTRMKASILAGCVPLVIQPSIRVRGSGCKGWACRGRAAAAVALQACRCGVCAVLSTEQLGAEAIMAQRAASSGACCAMAAAFCAFG